MCHHGRMEPVETLGEVECLASLRVLPLFADLDMTDLEHVSGVTSQHRYEPGEMVFSQGEGGDEMLIVVEGSAVVSRLTGGERRPVATLTPGDFVGELSLLTRDPRSADVHAGDEGLHGLVISAETLEAVVRERPRVGFAMLAALADRLATTPLPRRN